MDKKKFFSEKFLVTTFTLSGTIIGAGILGLPYVFSKSGFFIGTFWIIFLGLIMIYTFLCLGEVALRTRAKLQLLGYAEKYLGKKTKGLMFFALIFGIYSALVAYLIGEGESLSYIFTGSQNYSIYFAFAFWFLMNFLLKEGLKGLKKISTYGVSAVIFIVVLIAIIYSPEIKLSNLNETNFNYLFFPFGIVLFSLIGFNSIPELEMLIKGEEKNFKKAIIFGVLIPIILYIIFSFSVVGAFGKNVPEVATISLGKIFSLLGIFTMFSVYFILSFSLKDVCKLDLKLNKIFTFFLISMVPILIYLILFLFDKLSFINVLGIGGVISGGITAILILFMNKSAKKIGDIKPEYQMPINWLIIILLSAIFIAGIVFEVMF